MRNAAHRGRIRVGLVGASIDPWAWATTAHVPALQSLPEYELVAIASRSQARADAVAAEFGVPRAYGDYREMVESPDLDLICVSTSSAYHHALVLPAIDAGKHIFCEWPFGTTLGEALEMRDRARARGVRTLVGLQTRYAPIVAYVRDLIADDAIGEIWSVSYDRASDQTVQKDVSPCYHAFLERSNAGLRILGAHGLDFVAACVGELVDVQAYSAIGLKQLELSDGMTAPLTHKDHFVVQGRLGSGALFSAVIKQNSPIYKPFNLEISGSRGAIILTLDEDLRIAARRPGVPTDLTMLMSGGIGQPFARVQVPEHYRDLPASIPSGQPLNVAQMYRHFARALGNDLPCQTDFDHGVMRHRLLSAIETAAATGKRTAFSPT